MNCCNEYGQCTRGTDCAVRPSCDELAVCQSREPRCEGCEPPRLVAALSSRDALDYATAVVLGLALCYGLYGWCAW